MAPIQNILGAPGVLPAAHRSMPCSPSYASAPTSTIGRVAAGIGAIVGVAARRPEDFIAFHAYAPANETTPHPAQTLLTLGCASNATPRLLADHVAAAGRTKSLPCQQRALSRRDACFAHWHRLASINGRPAS